MEQDWMVCLVLGEQYPMSNSSQPEKLDNGHRRHAAGTIPPSLTIQNDLQSSHLETAGKHNKKRDLDTAFALHIFIFSGCRIDRNSGCSCIAI